MVELAAVAAEDGAAEADEELKDAREGATEDDDSGEAVAVIEVAVDQKADWPTESDDDARGEDAADEDAVVACAGEQAAGRMLSVSPAQSGEQHAAKKAVSCWSWQRRAR